MADLLNDYDHAVVTSDASQSRLSGQEVAQPYQERRTRSIRCTRPSTLSPNRWPRGQGRNRGAREHVRPGRDGSIPDQCLGIRGYRSQHELLPLFKKGDAPHVNNVELGKSGRWRSNVWIYPGASSLGSDARRGLKDHPIVKPVAMLMDAFFDLTQRGDIVCDPFLGSGSTLIAAEKAGRICRGVELDPLYVDVIIHRHQAATGAASVLVTRGESPRQLNRVAVSGSAFTIAVCSFQRHVRGLARAAPI
jgi:hypothetical protein